MLWHFALNNTGIENIGFIKFELYIVETRSTASTDAIYKIASTSLSWSALTAGGKLCSLVILSMNKKISNRILIFEWKCILWPVFLWMGNFAITGITHMESVQITFHAPFPYSGSSIIVCWNKLHLDWATSPSICKILINLAMCKHCNEIYLKTNILIMMVPLPIQQPAWQNVVNRAQNKLFTLHFILIKELFLKPNIEKNEKVLRELSP